MRFVALARDLAGDGGLSRHERLRRQRNVACWVDKHTGMCKTLLSLDPFADAKVWTAFQRCHGQGVPSTSTATSAPGISCRPTPSSIITRPPANATELGWVGAEVLGADRLHRLLHGGEATV